MKSECLYCLFFRAKKQVERLTTDEDLRYNALAGVIQIMAEHVTPNAPKKIHHPLLLCPSYIGTKRDRFLQNILQVEDIYEQEKIRLKALTRQLWSMIQRKTNLDDLEKKLKIALAIATTANIIEYDLLSQENEFYLEDLENIINDAEIQWDPLSIKLLPCLISEILKAKSILYLTDNVGEVIFDAQVINILLQLDKEITVAGKSKPILNDATIKDLQDLWVELSTARSPNIVSIGTNSVGLLLDEISNEFWEIIGKSDLIIAKGMGHFETLPEYDWNQPVWCLFRVKCKPVSLEAKSQLGKNCIRKI
ncbi:MAG: DUF89 domain-containing protein [Candidatus Thorarchaeota archaeon]